MGSKRRLGLVVKFNILTIVLIITTSIGIAAFLVYLEINESYTFLLQSFGKMGLLWSINQHGIQGAFFERQKCSAMK